MATLPKFIVIKSVSSGRHAYYMNESKKVRGYVRFEEPSVFSPFAKIEVEPSKSHRNYVHLRFCHTNKYWGRLGPGRNDYMVVASSDKPVEDTSKSSCTLFEATKNGQYLYLTHVQCRGRVRIYDGLSGSMSSCIYLKENAASESSLKYAFTFVDWDSLVKLPKYVTFKGDNGKYLKPVWYDGTPWGTGHAYLQFSGEDYNHEYVSYEVFPHPDGHLRIKSMHLHKFWRRSPNWIWGDSSDTHGSDVDTLFWPIKLDDRTIALRNAGNNQFCKRLTTEGRTGCLNAGIRNITTEARLVVEELVLERSIYNVRYRMEDARIYDEKPFVAGIGTATNDSDTESTLSIKVSYLDVTSHTFTYTLSLMVGVKTTIVTGIPKIFEGKIEVSAAVTNTLAWGKTTQTSKTAEATYTAKVPPRSQVTINYVGTEGKCDVPFSYTQRDKKSNDGSYVTSEHVDGIFNGVNYYSFRFEQPKLKAL